MLFHFVVLGMEGSIQKDQSFSNKVFQYLNSSDWFNSCLVNLVLYYPLQYLIYVLIVVFGGFISLYIIHSTMRRVSPWFFPGSTCVSEGLWKRRCEEMPWFDKIWRQAALRVDTNLMLTLWPKFLNFPQNFL